MNKPLPNRLPPGAIIRDARRQPGTRELILAHASKSMLSNAAGLWRSGGPALADREPPE